MGHWGGVEMEVLKTRGDIVPHFRHLLVVLYCCLWGVIKLRAAMLVGECPEIAIPCWKERDEFI